MPAIYEVVVTTTYSGQTMLNKWNYVYNGISTYPGGLGSLALMTALGFLSWDATENGFYPGGDIENDNNFAETFRRMRDSNCTLNLVSIRDVNSTTDFYEYLPSLPAESAGFHSSAGAPPFTGIGFQSTKTRTDINRGQKRIRGVLLAWLGDQGVVAGGASTFIDAFSSAQSAVLTADDENSFFPAIVSKERYEVEEDGAPSGKFAYRYYADRAEGIENAMFPVVWAVKPFVRGQASSQYGRGR